MAHVRLGVSPELLRALDSSLLNQAPLDRLHYLLLLIRLHLTDELRKLIVIILTSSVGLQLRLHALIVGDHTFGHRTTLSVASCVALSHMMP